MRRLLGGRLSRKFRNTRHVASRTSDICAKDMLRLRRTRSSNGRAWKQERAQKQGEVKWDVVALYDSLCRTALLWAMEIGLGAVGESVSVVFPESSFFSHRFVLTTFIGVR